MTGAYYGRGLILDKDTLKDGGGLMIVKYDSSGNVIWARTAKYSKNLVSFNITLDKNENIYAGGWYEILEIDTFNLSVPKYEIFLLKYDKDGNFKYLKSTQNNENLDIHLNSITTNKLGDVYAVGYFSSSKLTFDSIKPYYTFEQDNYPKNGFLARFTDTFTTSIQEKYQDIDNFKIYPNPITSDNLFIECELKQNLRADFIIYDVFGKKVKEVRKIVQNPGIYRFNINTSDLPAGIYICKLMSKNKLTAQRKIIKIKTI